MRSRAIALVSLSVSDAKKNRNKKCIETTTIKLVAWHLIFLPRLSCLCVFLMVNAYNMILSCRSLLF